MQSKREVQLPSAVFGYPAISFTLDGVDHKDVSHIGPIVVALVRR
jgi:hypothetical protein